MDNTFSILSSLNPPVAKKGPLNFYCTPQLKGNQDLSDDEVNSDSEKLKTNTEKVEYGMDVQRLKCHRRAFSTCWIDFLKLPIDSDEMFKKILSIIHKQIIPFLNHPTKLIDFLTDSYNAGGSVSLLALNGLFTLINEYNLDYPDFYKKLYSLLDINVMHTKYRSRFFRMLNLFLSSTHLPVYLVAAFAKRLIRLSLTAPPAAILSIVPLVFNLLQRHPQCLVLIHRVNEITPETDTFNFEDLNPETCGALQSSMWEIQ
ncbi:Nucleolar complex protein 4, partial [Nowakowskiella sp. JEL0078]